MKLGILIILAFLGACSHPQMGREIASVEYPLFYGKIDKSQSVLKLFSPEHSKNDQQYLFFLGLKNEIGQPMDVDPQDIVVKSTNGILLSEIERASMGQYIVSVDQQNTPVEKINFVVQGKVISQKSTNKVAVAPDLRTSKIQIIEVNDEETKLRLFLNDKDGNKIESRELPEIIAEGSADAQNIRFISKGVWEFDLIHPNVNILLYLSVRLNGTYLEKMFRFQHLERAVNTL